MKDEKSCLIYMQIMGVCIYVNTSMDASIIWWSRSFQCINNPHAHRSFSASVHRYICIYIMYGQGVATSPTPPPSSPPTPSTPVSATSTGVHDSAPSLPTLLNLFIYLYMYILLFYIKKYLLKLIYFIQCHRKIKWLINLFIYILYMYNFVIWC